MQAANFIHAAGESGPVPEHCHAVALVTNDEVHLRAIALKLRAAGIRFRSIVECDGDHTGQMMAIGIHPRPKSEVRKLLSSLPLLK